MSTSPRSRRRLLLATVPLALLLAACGADAPSTSDLISDDPTLDEGDIGGHDEVGDPAAAPAGGAAGMCPVGTTDCVDADLGEAGDPIIAPDIHVVDALPADIRMVEMNGDSAESFPLFVQEAAVDGARLDLVFSGGEMPCFWVHHVEVTESDTEVVVDLQAGGDPAADGCDQQAISIQGVTVELTAPLGDRALLDASRVVG